MGSLIEDARDLIELHVRQEVSAQREAYLYDQSYVNHLRGANARQRGNVRPKLATHRKCKFLHE